MKIDVTFLLKYKLYTKERFFFFCFVKFFTGIEKNPQKNPQTQENLD